MSDPTLDAEVQAMIASLNHLAETSRRKQQEEEAKIPLVQRGGFIDPASEIQTEAVLIGQIGFLYEIAADLWQVVWEISKSLDHDLPNVQKTTQELLSEFEKRKRAFKFVDWLASEHKEPTSNE